MEKSRELAIEIIDVFEDLLDRCNVVIDSEERKEAILNEQEEVAAIYGEEYYRIEDEITKILGVN
ncbi:hypothetical protein ACFO26_01705 [Lactococcus nasutitermitis]|uniref:Uncharacterized protein n=1 Tax=Lactococcus nasutitermitis TaxID=1652957 RepID=A0ABV9JE20_9LACT|nr:hypothetical protein [Lactococcus nasutitermitis]